MNDYNWEKDKGETRQIPAPSRRGIHSIVNLFVSLAVVGVIGWILLSAYNSFLPKPTLNLSDFALLGLMVWLFTRNAR